MMIIWYSKGERLIKTQSFMISFGSCKIWLSRFIYVSFKCFMQILVLVKGPGFPSMEKKVLCLFTGLSQAAERLDGALEGFLRIQLDCLRCYCFDINFHPHQFTGATHRDQMRLWNSSAFSQSSWKTYCSHLQGLEALCQEPSKLAGHTMWCPAWESQSCACTKGFHWFYCINQKPDWN